jgi:hypothetical protein
MSSNNNIILYYNIKERKLLKLKEYSILVIFNFAKFTAENPGDTGCNGAYNVLTYFMAIQCVQENEVLEKTQFTTSKLQNTQTYTLTPIIINK